MLKNITSYNKNYEKVTIFLDDLAIVREEGTVGIMNY